MNWQYKIINMPTSGFVGGNLDDAALENNMNELGSQGWELVSAFDTSMGGTTSDALLIFKKKL